jgi:hypothetical protein
VMELKEYLEAELAKLIPAKGVKVIVIVKV